MAEVLPHDDGEDMVLCARVADGAAVSQVTSTELPLAEKPVIKSKTAFFTSEICERHNVPAHPECFQRSVVIRERILKDFPSIHLIQSIKPVTEAQLLAFHTKQHVDNMLTQFHHIQDQHKRQGNLKNGKSSIMIDIDGDTTIMEGTEAAAMAAAGAVCQAIDLVMSPDSDIANAFCGVRPPGHHAEPDQPMGFCLFNNVGIGACHLLQQYPTQITRVLILDFDVHHGNGTQAKFLTGFPQICFVSTHQGQFYPFTGTATERGSHDNIVNVPLASRTASQAYRKHFLAKVLPVLHAFKPEFVLVSAGFDAHRLDPLAEIALETEDYYWITKHITQIANEYAQGRIVSTLEGGYHLDALADSAAAHVRALMEAAAPLKPAVGTDSETGASTRPSPNVDTLTDEFAATLSLDVPPPELRVTVHFDSKPKLLVLKERSTKALMQQCKNKFTTLRKKAKTVSLLDAHGALVTDDILRTLAHDQHLYLR